MEEVLHWIVWFVEEFGYIGIFIMTFLESTFVPIPSEVTMIPAGYLVQQGKMNLSLVLICSILGTIGGSLFNYYLARIIGRPLVIRYSRYFLLTPEKIQRIEQFFYSHGEISIFSGRLIPGLRHFISFPAGLAHMRLDKFCIYTGLGGAIWMTVLLAVGYIIGDNEALIHKNMPFVIAFVVLCVALIVLVYFYRHNKKLKRLANEALSSRKEPYDDK